MSDCIKREGAKRELCEWATNLHDPRFLIKGDAMCVLDNIPVAEVEVLHEPTESEFKRMAIQKGYEPVVHCPECKHHHDYGTHFCDRLGMDCPDDSDFFCKYGVRMGGGEEDA